MVIENREAVVAGTKLTATYKKQDYACRVELGADGKLAYLYDGKAYNSPSSAGTAVMGTACNGWRFWTIEGEAVAAVATATKATAKTSAPKKARTKAVKVFYKIPNQRGTAEGVTRFYCNGCAASFESESQTPEACPLGHRYDDPELTSAATGAAVASDQAEVAFN